MQFIWNLSDLKRDDLELAGGKAASLGDMISAGLPVPQGFCVTTNAYKAFVAANNLEAEIIRLSEETSADHPESLVRACELIRTRFVAGQIPDELSTEIQAAYTHLANLQSATGKEELAVAVRSSATAEDLPGASFAGQQDTYLNIRGQQAVLDAVKRCWASLWTERAMGYRLRQNIPPQDVSLAVVVQQIIPAESAGVLFTANPVTGAQNEILINAAWGLGEAIVGGLVTPDQIVLDKVTGKVKEEHIADKQVMTICTVDGTMEQHVPEAQRFLPVLTADHFAQLASLAYRIEVHVGMPMDLEWAVYGGKVYLLQARPITALPPAIPEQPDLLGAEWSRLMLIERYPDPITPLTWSMISETLFSAFNESSRLFGHTATDETPLIRLMYGRPYINVTRLNQQFESMPMRPPVSESSSSNRRARRPNPGAKGLLALGRMMKLILTVHRSWERLLPPYIASVKKEAAQPWETMPTASLLECLHRQDQQSAIMLENHAHAIIAAEITLQALQGITRSWLGDTDSSLAITLLSGLTGNVTVETNRALWRLAVSVRGNQALRQTIAAAQGSDWRAKIEKAPGGKSFLRDMDAFLNAYGHRSPRYEFSVPTWGDQPQQVLELVQLYLDDTVPDPGDLEAKKAAEREATTRSARKRLSLARRFIFNRALSLAQTYFRLRENQQFYLVMGLPTLRRILLTLGRRFCEAGILHEIEDVFFLENSEIRALAAKLAGLSGHEANVPANPVQLVTERKATFQQHCAFTAPIHLGGQMTSPDVSPAGVLRGIPASRGTATGKARVVRGPADFSKVQRGEIIVTPATTPAWTPLFGVAAGLVTDYGGLLSHAGVVAREYGLPAVLGTSEATRTIKDGDEVTVYGETGEVRVKPQ